MTYRLGLAALGLALAALIPASAAEPDPLLAVAQGFYRTYLQYPSNGIPSGPERSRLAPYVTPSLDALFAQGVNAEARYREATKHLSPPLVEGDLFTPNFEGATAFQVLTCRSEGDRGRCQVRLTYDDRKNNPLVWTDTALLVRGPSGWRIDDVAYGSEFGGKGSVRQTLKNAIDEGERFAGGSQ